MADKPVTREEKYLAYLTGDYTGEIPKPITRKEKYLYELCLKGIGGEISPEEIKAAVNEYLEKNPVKPGATTEQAQQIEQNKKDVNSLREDLSNKITKFYASNQGETHLTDSDNGKIQDMVLYGKSSQDGTPTPENPVEIKGVVNPTVKVRGANLLKLDFTPKSNSGVTIDVVENKIRFHGTISSTYTYWYVTSPLLIKKGTKVSLHVDDFNNHGVFVWFSKVGDDNIQTINKWTPSAILNEDRYLAQIGIEGYTPGDTIDFTTTFAVLDNTNQYEPYHEQTVTLPYTLNAIPVESGGNVTIDGQQYIADYVDCERGAYIQRIKKYTFSGDEAIRKSGTYQPGGAYTHETIRYQYNLGSDVSGKNFSILCSHFGSGRYATNVVCSYDGYVFFFAKSDDFQTENDFSNFLKQQKNDGHPVELFYILATPIETPLTSEEINALKSLSTNYPVTNISVNSEQLDGYTVFNYPISMENGWNYVKQQLNDNRDYIYDMDLQSAEAYVNSEYAVALTELEV